MATKSGPGIRVALIGNPNSGKTTLFNALTGAHQRVGNWPGVTVEQKTGSFHIKASQGVEAASCEVTDLPGIYSLAQESLGLDEKIAKSYLQAGDYDLVVNIVDAGNLERNLVLTQQLIDLQVPLLVALNMVDVAKRDGVEVDPARLATELGTPVVPIVASRGIGIDQLVKRIASQGPVPSLATKKSLATQQSPAATSAPEPTETYSDTELVRRYHRAQEIAGAVVTLTPSPHTLSERIDKWVLNKWLGLPIFLAMMYLMFTVAINVGALFIDFFDLLFGALVVDTPKWLLASAQAPAWLTVLLADGLGGGIQLVATFIPVIGALFLCLSLLEASGYMARAAFVIDKLMAAIGLPGNAFVPLIVGFGCNVPAVMATRSLNQQSDRLLTIAMAPFMSCGARLTVYALFAAAFFPVNGQNLVFALYLLGIAMAVLTGWLFRRQIFAGEATPSFQEMPAYHLPVARNLLLTSWFRLRAFMLRAGKTIVLVVICLSFLNSIGKDGSFGNENTDQSILAAIGKSITPVFSPLGLEEDNWPATVGLFTGLFAKEAVVGTLDALYSHQPEAAASPPTAEPMADAANQQAPDFPPPDIPASVLEALTSIKDNATDLASRLVDPLGIRLETTTELAAAAAAQGVETSTLTNMAQQFGSQFAAFCYLVFVLLYAPCVAVLGATAKEAGLKWMLLTFAWTTGLAYITASGIYQLGTFSANPQFSAIWLVSSLLVAAVCVRLLGTLGRKAVPQGLIPVTPIA